MGEKKPRVNMTMRLRVLTALFLVIGFGLVGVRLLVYAGVPPRLLYAAGHLAPDARYASSRPNRGKIYDANMQVLAESAEVERITVIAQGGRVDETKEKNGDDRPNSPAVRTLATHPCRDARRQTMTACMEKLNKNRLRNIEIIAQKVDKDVTKDAHTPSSRPRAAAPAVYSEPDTKRLLSSTARSCPPCSATSAATTTAPTASSRSTTSELSGTAGRIVRVQNAQNEDIVPYDYAAVYPGQRTANSLVLTIDSDIQNYPREASRRPRSRTIRRRATAFPASS